ncbi:MAG: 3-phosphoshikimate 1-carboxyvinyltransferase [Crocinitomicaceae bacterium]
MKRVISPSELTGTIAIPSSKSDGQRAILAAGLSKGVTVLHGIGKSDDEQAMLRNMLQLGGEVKSTSGESTIIQGIKDFPTKAKLNAGESGLGMRLITGVCAGQGGDFVISGEGSLPQRPQRFFEEHLSQMGVKVVSNNGYLPLSLQGKIIGGKVEIDGSTSSQFLSGMLMSLPLIEEDSTLVVRKLKSIPYVQMTLNTLAAFGIEVEHENFERFFIKGKQSYSCDEYTIEGDWSSASYWLVASALGHSISVTGLNLESAQADKALLEMLKAANCIVDIHDDFISVDGAHRTSFMVDATHCPDLFPALVTFAAFCDGVSTISGVHRLATKESDRGVVLQKEFGKLGLKIELIGDEMLIHGGTRLTPAEVDSHNDHRIAMCLAIVASQLEGETTIVDAEAVSKSYPDFWEDFDHLSNKFVQ